MSSFKHRSNKLKYLSNVQTVDELHKNYLAKLDDKRSSLPTKKEQLDNLLDDLQKIERSEMLDSTDIKKRSQIKSKIKELEADIKKIEGNSEIMDYISKTGNILVSYYTSGKSQYNVSDDTIEISKRSVVDFSELTETVTVSETEILEPSVIVISDRLVELNLLSQQSRKIKNPVKKRRAPPQSTGATSILNYFAIQDNVIQPEVETKVIVNKALLQEKYLYLTDKTYACGKSKTSKIIYCTTCNLEKILCQSDAYYVCGKCGETEYIMIENEISNHKEINEKQQKYPYKKVNHLKEKLNQFQSKESSDVSDEICNIVINDLKKKRVDRKRCVPPDVMAILRKHRFTTYYEHLQQIYCKISGSTPITLSREVEETIINMFQTMQDSFHKHCPESRSNFLSYSYVLNKLFRILNMEDHAKYFALLKSKEKLRDQDIIWNKICKEMDWKFYSSF
jgi:hypothetical protein